MRKWTYDEVVLALYAYCHVPFNRAHNNNPWIIKIASIIERTPASVKMKIGNLGAFDPTLKEKGITGLVKTSKIDEEVWNDYYGKWDSLINDAENIIAQKDLSQANEIILLPEGTEAYYTAKRRLNQDFFRSCVLSSYNNRCCITNITNPRLLEACHIKSWTDHKELRVDPSNGLCFNKLLHAAYDNFLVSITPDYNIVFSEEFIESCKDETLRFYFAEKNEKKINLPSRFYPYKDGLQEHYEKFKHQE